MAALAVVVAAMAVVVVVVLPVEKARALPMALLRVILVGRRLHVRGAARCDSRTASQATFNSGGGVGGGGGDGGGGK